MIDIKNIQNDVKVIKMQNYKSEIITSKVFNIRANTAQEALDFISHAYLNSDIVDTNNANTQFVLFSCKSNDGTDNGEYMAVRNGNSFNIVNTNNQ
mgnify:FL=1